jgi:hypothetical protein
MAPACATNCAFVGPPADADTAAVVVCLLLDPQLQSSAADSKMANPSTGLDRFGIARMVAHGH